MNYRTLANVVGALLLIAVVLPFAIYAVPGLIGADESFVVLTGSMEPEISPGDVVIVGGADPATIAEGDVITFTRPGSETPVTHRVVGVDSGESIAFETRGDANDAADAAAVPAANVIGVVVLTIPAIGYVIQATNTPIGFALLVAVPLALLVISELWSLFVAARRGGDEPAGSSDPGAGGGPAEPAEDGSLADRGAIGSGRGSVASLVRSAGGPGERWPRTTAAVAGRSGDEWGGRPDDDPAADEPTADESDPPATITFAPSDLSLSAVVLGVATPYSVYVALELTTALTISVAFAVASSFVAVAGLRLSARLGGASDEPDESPAAGPRPIPDRGDWGSRR